MSDPSGRPDPITPKVTGWTVAATLAAAFAAVLIDSSWHAPEGNNLMDWIRSLLPAVLVFLAARHASTQAKKETTPLIDPRDAHLRKLVPADTPTAAGAAPAVPSDDEPGSGFFDQQGDRGSHHPPGESPGPP